MNLATYTAHEGDSPVLGIHKAATRIMGSIKLYFLVPGTVFLREQTNGGFGWICGGIAPARFELSARPHRLERPHLLKVENRWNYSRHISRQYFLFS
jgi:hypothetical protein